MPRPENPIQLAVIGAAHGTRGEVRVKTFTGDPLAIADYGLLYDEQGKSYEVLEARPGKTVVVVRFKGINDRNAAEALNGTELSSTAHSCRMTNWTKTNSTRPI